MSPRIYDVIALSLCNKSKDIKPNSSTLTNAQTITGIRDSKNAVFLTTLQAEHNEASALAKLIAQAQAKIDASAPYLSQDRSQMSYFAPVAWYHGGQIKKYTAIRIDLTNKYLQLSWKLYSKDLPVFGSSALSK